VDLLVSHTHWDHIQGLPFFAPVFGDENTVRIWGAKQADRDLEGILREQMNPVVFPVPLDTVAAKLSVAHVGHDEFEVDGFKVRTMRLRHPGNTLGFRLTPIGGGKTFGYATDNELGPGGEYDVGPTWREEFVDFLHGVDVLVHDAMFSPEEAVRFAGWGHSSNVEAVELAVEAGAKQLLLFHHSPEHDDDTVDALLEQAREVARDLGGGIEVVAAHEGMELTL
jgi:phosphoribosyl 1,2-cyclic phosphodiesterase